MKRALILVFLTFSLYCFSQNNFLNGQSPSTFKYINLESFDSDYIQYIYQTEGMDGINFYGSRLLDENHDGLIDIVMRAKEHLEGEWDLPSTPPRRFVHLNIFEDFTSKLQAPNEYVFDGDKFLYHSDETGDYYLNFFWGDPIKIDQIGVDNYQDYLSNIGYEFLEDYVVDSNNEYLEFSPRVYKLSEGTINDFSDTSLVYSEELLDSTAKFPWDMMMSPGDFDGDGDQDFLMYAWSQVFEHPELISRSNNNSRGYFYFFENMGNGKLNVSLLTLNGFEDVTWAIQEGTYSVSVDIDSDGKEESLNEITWWSNDNPPSTGNVGTSRSFGFFKINKSNASVDYVQLLSNEEYLESPNWNIGPRFIKQIKFDELEGDFILLYNTSQAGSHPTRIDGAVTSFTNNEIQQSFKVFKIDSANSRLIDFTSSVFLNGEEKTLSLDNSGRPYLIDVDFDGDQDLFLQIGQTPNSNTGGKAQFESFPSWSGKINTLFYFENTGSGFQLKDLAEIKKLYPSNFDHLEDYTIFDDNGFYTSEDGRQFGIENFIFFNTFSLNDIDNDDQWELITSTNPDYISVLKRKEEGAQNPYENITVIGQSIHRVNEEVINYNFLENNYLLNKNEIYKKIDPNYELKLVLKDPDSKIIREPYSGQKYLTQNKSGEKQFYFAWPNYQQTEEVNPDEDLKYSRFPHFGDQEFSLGSKYDVDLNIPTEDGVLITNHSFDLSEDNLPPLPFNLIDVDTIQSENTSFEIKFHSSTDINQNYHQGNENYSVTFRGNTLSNSQIPGPKYYYEVYVNRELHAKVDDISYTISQDDQGYNIVESFQIETGLASTEGVTFKVFAIDTDDQSIITEMSTVNIDADQDGIIDSMDNCPSYFNPGQEDSNNNGIGDICDDDLPDPNTFQFKLSQIQNSNTFDQLVNPYLISDEYYALFNQGYEIIDYDNDGKLDFATMFYESSREINKSGIGIFSFNLENNTLDIGLDAVLQIDGEPNANAPEIVHLDEDENLDIFIPTGNYHGNPGTQPDFYNGTGNRPDFLYYRLENGFKVDSLAYTYNNQKYANTSLQKSIQIDTDLSNEIAILTYEGSINGKGALGFFDFNSQTNRHELAYEIFTSQATDVLERFNDIHNIDFNEDQIMDLLSLHVRFGATENQYYVNIYQGTENGSIDLNNRELIYQFSEDSKWFIAENEEFTSVQKINNRVVLFVQYAGKDGVSSKLEAYDLSNLDGNRITSYLFGNEFISRNFDGLGHYWTDIDNDGDNDLIVEHSGSESNPNIIYIQNNGRLHPIQFNLDDLKNDIPYYFIDLDQDSVYDLIDVVNNKFYKTVSILDTSDSDLDGVINSFDQCPDTPAGAVVNTSGCEVFALPANTFSVSVTSATCPDSSNGSITISSSNTDYSYRYAIDNQAPVALTDNTQTISNLSAGTYTICVTVDGVADYQRCYTIEISEPAPLVASSRVDVSARNLQLDLSGSEEYQVTLNGKTFLTSEDKLSLNLQPGMNRIEVATALDCQGVYFEEIFVSEEVKVYPNPTEGPLQLFVAGSDSEVTLSITSLSGSIIKKETISVPTNRIIETTLGNLPEGLYLITLNGTTVKTTHKVIKE